MTEEHRGIRSSLLRLLLAVTIPFVVAPLVFSIGRRLAPYRYDYENDCLIATLAIGSAPLWFRSVWNVSKVVVIASYGIIMAVPVAGFMILSGNDLVSIDYTPRSKEMVFS